MNLITSMLEFIALGTVGFWLLLGIETLFIIGCVENKSTGWGFVWGVLLLLLIKPIFDLAPSWQWLVGGFFAYFFIGAVWSIVKWYFHVKKEVRDELANYKKTKGDEKGYDPKYLKLRLQPSENKNLLCLWIAYWPWSVLWSLTRDLVINIVDALTHVYQNITNAAFKKLENEKSAQPK